MERKKSGSKKTKDKWMGRNIKTTTKRRQREGKVHG